MADKTNPTDGGISNFLPRFYRTDANKKFLQATIEQLVKPGTVKKINGYVGRKNAKAAVGEDIFVAAPTVDRQNYQLEPSITIDDALGNTTFFKDYQDYINQLNVFGANVKNHSRLNEQEFYSWDPHIDWDKFVNFQQYYWLPYGPDPITIFGQQKKINSTFTVEIDIELDDKSFLFTPNGLTRNPTIKLFRGQTYKFEVNSPGEPFSIKTRRVGGSDDRYAELNHIDNFAVEKGVVTFVVPEDAPDVLFYVSETNIDMGGVFQILDIKDNTEINVEEQLIGKRDYTLANGTKLSNGMKVSFGGNVLPAEYAKDQYYIEGVGTAIKLVAESSLALITPYSEEINVLFDDTKFDELPFNTATVYSGQVDYIAINRASRDKNPWSRYNKWFHQDVINKSAAYNGKIADLNQNIRAVRPIIEFNADLKLYNFGLDAAPDVDLIDTYTTDVFSTIEGALGYNIDGVPLVNGHKILFTADNDILVKNKTFQVKFIEVQDSIKQTRVRQLHLVEINTPLDNQVVVIRSGESNKGTMRWFNGSDWLVAQNKTSLNQPPLFDIVDENGNSFADKTVYDGSTFAGTKIFSYKLGSGSNDTYLNFPLSYRNINNVGDIVFNFDVVGNVFQYKDVEKILEKNVSTGFFVKSKGNNTVAYENGWQKSVINFTYQPALRIYKNSNQINNFDLDIFDDKHNLTDLEVRIYVNGIRLDKSKWSMADGAVYKKIQLVSNISTNDILTIKAFASQPINANGFYEIPFNLQNNPLNSAIGDFTLGEVIDHVNSIIDNLQTFEGQYPGSNNLRDLGNTTVFGTKFVQHSGPMSLALYHITNPNSNVIRAIEKSRDEYGQFKRNFLSVALGLGIDTDTKQHVDLVLQELNKDKPKKAAYYFSDMVPYGSAVKNEYTVIDYRILTYPLTQVFDLDRLSNRAVGVYLNGVQLVYGIQYEFDSQGFVRIITTMQDGDLITIYEYDNTDGSFVPQTPTKLGIWPAFEPKIYLDTSLITPRTMIQGHDGSQVLAFGDFRDELILELEKRIFNNIKVKYNPAIFDVYDILPGYGRENDYSLKEFNEVLAPNFFKWTTLIDRDFTKPLSFDKNNSLTFNYRGQTAPDGREVPGYWRGIYRWMLDTDRPNICPWECLGYTIEPSWWQDVYGPAPYTSNNKVMWQDLSEGIIKEPGKPIARNPKFIRPFLIDCIPVDEFGNLISPLFSNMAAGLITQSTSGDFVFGDVSPIEAAWRRSSYYPFSLLLTSILLKPANTFGVLLDRSRIIRNLTGQLVYKDTGLRVTPTDLILPNIYSSDTRVQTAGLINYIVDYVIADNSKSYDQYLYDLNNIGFKLSYRVSGFTSKDKFNLLLDSKNPTAVGGVFVPPENFKIVLNSSSPIKRLTYSGVIITKLHDGYEVKGYSKTTPYFEYYPWIQSGNTINVGGMSESYIIWSPNQRYTTGKVVSYGNSFYRCTVTHVASDTFEQANFQRLPKLPVIGGRDAVLRKLWDRRELLVLPYGTKFRTIQEVVDFLQGYGERLKDQGFVFDDFNNTLGQITNWETSAKEFLFWTTQNWSSGQDKWNDWSADQPVNYGSIVRYNGDYYRAVRNVPTSSIFEEQYYDKLEGLSTVGSSVIALSPAANKIVIKSDFAVVDDILNQFNGYDIFKVDGTKLEPNFLNSYRAGNLVTYSPANSEGIFGATFFLIQKEQVVILDNNTLFNDTIYNPESGYRQERIKTSSYVSTTWDGSFDVPGFIFDQAKIQEWNAWTDYSLGDIIKYKEFYYSAKTAIVGESTFNDSEWTRLSEKPTPNLLPNWSYKAAQFTDFYSLDSGNFDVGQQTMAQHLIGYQKRQYLSNIIKDDVSEFKFYQGMIIEKGTQNSLNKLFDVLSADGQESLKFFEEWAVRVGQYGASSAFEDIEFTLDQSLFKNNPQGVELTQLPVDKLDFIIRQTPNDVYLKPFGYNSQPWLVNNKFSPFLRTPGYVRREDAALVLDNINEILTKNPDPLNEGDYVWCAFEGREWNIYRYTASPLKLTDATYTSNTLTLTFDEQVRLEPGTYISVVQVDKFSGFYKIDSVTLNQIKIKTALKVPPATPFIDQTTAQVLFLKSQRIDSIDDANSILPDNIGLNEKLWTDNRGDGKWAVWNYSKVFEPKEFVNSSPTDELAYGRSISTDIKGQYAAVSTRDEIVITYDKVPGSNKWLQRQSIAEPFIFALSNRPANISAGYSFGETVSVSKDGEWLVVSSPRASFASTYFAGEHNSGQTYSQDQVVYSNLFHYSAKQSVPVGTAITNTQYWKPTNIIETTITGASNALTRHGAISLYKIDISNTANYVGTIISPYPASDELFGTSITFGNDTMFVSAVDKVYQLNYNTITATATYLPLGSTGIMLKVSSTATIEVGMFITGTGFQGYQTVARVIDSTTIQISEAPNATPFGTLTFKISRWEYSYNRKYKGQWNNTAVYLKDDLVQYKNKLYLALSTVTSLDTPVVNVEQWIENNPTNITGVFPQQLTPTYLPLTTEKVEAVQTGNQYGYSVSLSNDFTKLIVSAPLADQTTYATFKGQYNIAMIYAVDDIVLYNNAYYKCIYNFNNTVAGVWNGSRWEQVFSINQRIATGKVFVYTLTNNSYILTQTLSATGNAAMSNQRFGDSVAVSGNGKYLAIGSTLYDGTNIDQGRVLIYDQVGTNFNVYQELVSNNPETAEFFGAKLAFMNNYETLVVFSANGDSYKSTVFDTDSTIFDNGVMNLVEDIIDSGRIDVYDRYATKWIYSESLQTDAVIGDGYGTGFTVGSNTILIGAPYATDRTLNSGLIFSYEKPAHTLAWTQIQTEEDKPDISKIKKAFLYNKRTNKLITYLDIIDPIQGKVPGIAEQEIKFKTYYDPATYTVGTSAVKVDDGQAWTTTKVGMLWWDLTRAKFIDSYGGDVVYRNTTWNTLFDTASIDIYEWVETSLKPAEWDKRADTEVGLSSNISGTSLYGNSVYSVKKRYDNVSKTFKETYYFWVKNKKTIPNVQDRRMSASDVSGLISNPKGQGYKYLALTGLNSFSLVNVKPLLQDTDVVLSVQYWTIDKTDQNIHSEWRLISSDENTALPASIEEKWFDSLCGKDQNNRVVPDLNLPPKLRYGAEFRPRQSLFVNRFEALKQFVERANSVMLTNQIVETRDILALSSYDPQPSIITALYDEVFDTDAELRFASVSTFKAPSLLPIIQDGSIVGVEIIEAGNGYVTAPYITVKGNGHSAELQALINSRGQVVGVKIIEEGKGYDSATVLELRNYSVLIRSDSQALNRWSIYAYTPNSRTWSRTQSQAYDTRRYWNYADWYAADVNQFTLADFSVETISDINNLTVKIGQYVKVRTTGSGSWDLLQKYADSISIDWTQSYKVVGSQNGTIQLSSELYKFSDTTLGFDGALFDGDTFDNTAVIELRIILETLKNKIFIDTLKQTYLDLFFVCLRYALSEQTYLDWAFKTSFVRAQHNVGPLKQKVTFNNDNLADFEAYIAEVKPYRTQIREYVSEYTAIDQTETSVTDFDILPVYREGKTLPVAVANVNGDIQSLEPAILTYPWKYWLDNVGFEILSIKIVDQGSGYITEPVVRIIDPDTQSTSTAATARAFISNGKLSRIVLLTSGKGYLTTPTIVIDGGLDIDGTPARAIAIIGNSVVRSNLIKMKFDRTSRTYFITELEESAAFTGTGNQLQFALKWAPDIRIGKSLVKVDGVEVLRANYKLAVNKSTVRGYTSYYGTLTFETPPAKAAVITIDYIKDWSLLSAADRIQYYYDPKTGQLGKDLAQLMTGVDYGGVIITGLDFGISTGWDSVPYFSDRWDEIDPTFDDYIIKAGLNSNEFTLPYIPEYDTVINIYHNGIRIDDLNYGTEQQTNINATMQTFVGDGIISTISLPSIAVTVDTDLIAAQGATAIQLTDVLTIQPGSLVLSPNVIVNGSTVIFVTGNVVPSSTTGSINNTLLTAPGLTTYATGMKVTGIGVAADTYIVSVTPGVQGIAEIQKILVTGTATGPVSFLGSVVPSVVSGNTAKQVVNRIVSNRAGIISAWNSLNPTRIIQELEIDLFEDGDSTIKVTYSLSSGNVPNLPQQISNGINFGNSVTSRSGLAGTVSTAVISVSQVVGPTMLTFTPVIEISNAILADISSLSELVVGNVSVFTAGNQLKNSTKITVSNATGVNEGDIVSSLLERITTSAILSNTAVVDIDPVTNIVTLSTPLSSEIPAGTALTFGYNKLAFRKSTSDGSIKPQEVDYDTSLSGGAFVGSALTSATGLAPDDIILDGDGLVTPTTSSDLEEVVPGQILDAVAIKVFYRPTSGAANIRVDNHIANGTTQTYSFNQYINSSEAVLVKVDDTILTLDDDYQVDYRNRTIELSAIPQAGAIVSIFNYGFNGSGVLDIDYFVGDDDTFEFITKAPWLDTVSAIAYVDGLVEPFELFQTDDTYDSVNTVGIRFGATPVANAIINYVIVDNKNETFSLVKSERFVSNGTATVFNLENPVGTTEPYAPNVIVRAGQTILAPANNVYFTIGKNKLNYTIDQTKARPYEPDMDEILVYVDGVQLQVNVDYIIDPAGITVKINRTVYNNNKGKLLVISIINNQQYLMTGTSLVLMQPRPTGTEIEVVNAYKHQVLDIHRTSISAKSDLSYEPDTVEYYNFNNILSGYIKLDRPVIDDAGVWVTKNGQLLTPSVDYKLNTDKQSITLLNTVAVDDKIDLITYSTNVYQQTMSYMQFKDMLNRTHFKRLALSKQTKLTQPLNYYDFEIYVEDASTFDVPNMSKNLPGVVEINGERIEYFEKDGNVLRRLRRGTLGTGTAQVYPRGTKVQDIGPSETIPYRDETRVLQFTSSGSNTFDLEFLPTKSNTEWSFANGFASTIPTGYGQSNDIEVFVGGYDNSQIWIPSTSYQAGTIVQVGSYNYRCVTAHTSSTRFSLDSAYWQFFVGNIRLKKHPFKVHNVGIHSESPEGDVQFDPDFAVDGETTAVRLTNALDQGVKVTVVKKTGRLWTGITYNPTPAVFDGVETDFDTGTTVFDQRDSAILSQANRNIIEFLRAEPGIWYSGSKNVIGTATYDSSTTTFDGTETKFDKGN